MQYTKIPGTDMQASRICLGTMTFGSPVAGPDAVRLVRYALEEHGVNFIDTANMYEGYNRYAGSAGGVAEEIVGEAVKVLVSAPPDSMPCTAPAAPASDCISRTSTF